MKKRTCGLWSVLFVLFGTYFLILQTSSANTPPPGQVAQVETSVESSGGDDVNSKQIKVTTTFPDNLNGICQMEVTLKGKGVEDKLTETCCSEKPVESVSTDDVFIFGNPRKCLSSIYSNVKNAFYYLKNNVCTKKTFTTTNGKTTSESSPVEPGMCTNIRKAVSDFFNSVKDRIWKWPAAGQVSPVTAAEALKEFEPTYPIALGKPEINSKYDIAVIKYIDSFNIQGCYCYITAKGNGINDHFQVPCSNENNNGVSAEDFMLFGSPTSTLGLFTDTPNTLIIMNKGTCYKKTYGEIPTGPTLMGGPECEEVKERMMDRMDTYGSVNGGVKISGSSTSSPSGQDRDIPIAYSPVSRPEGSISPLLLPQFTPVAREFLPSPSSSNPVPAVNGPALVLTSSTTLGVSSRAGSFDDIKYPQFTIEINKEGALTCTVQIVGRYVNDIIKDQCSVLGGNIKTFDKGNILVVVDPSKQSGIYSDNSGTLVFLKEGLCYSKTYDTQYGRQTKITTNLLHSVQCTDVKSSMESAIEGDFGKDPESLTSITPTSRPGNFQRVYNSGTPDMTITKNYVGPDGCTVTVSLMGRGINDEMKDSCSVLGTNLMRKVTPTNLAIADPTSKTGFYSDYWGYLVVIKWATPWGQCFLRKYDTSAVTHTTQITSSPMDSSECNKIKDNMSAALGVNFGGQ